MSNVIFVPNESTILFSDLEVGTYFKFAGKLYVKLYEHKSPYYDKAVEEGADPYDYKENAFCISNDDFIFFDETDEVKPVESENIQIKVVEDGE